MAVITKVWTAPNAARQDPAQPITSQWGNDVWDDLEYLKQWLGQDFIAGAVQNHNHDGVNSSEINVITGLIPNGSFESFSGTLPNGWTKTEYTGGTVALTGLVNANGDQSLAITSIDLADGGGEIIHDAYRSVTGGNYIPIDVIRWASIANISCKADVIWYDKDKVQISITNLFTDTNTSLTSNLYNNSIQAPTTARFMRLRLTGGIPATGTAVGTIYFDGCIAVELPANSIRQIHMQSNSVPQSALQASVVGQSELKTAIQSVSTNAANPLYYNRSGGNHTINERYRAYATTAPVHYGTTDDYSVNTSFVSRFNLWRDGNLFNVYGESRYITASKPYDLGDGEVPLFIFMMVEKGTGKVIAVSLSPEAPWHYNGFTSIIASRKEGARSWKEVPQIISDLNEANLTKQEAVRLGVYTEEEIINRIVADGIIEMEITQAMKQADMPLIPHTFTSPENDLRNVEIVMLNPVAPLTEMLLELHDEGENVCALIHDGKIKFNNTALNLVTPAGVMAVDFTL